MLRRYAINVFEAADQLINALLGGDPQETLSSRMAKRARRREWPAICFCWILGLFDPCHCEKALNSKEGAGSGPADDELF